MGAEAVSADRKARLLVTSGPSAAPAPPAPEVEVTSGAAPSPLGLTAPPALQGAGY